MRQKTETTLIAEYLLSLQPAVIRGRLHKDESFKKRIGLQLSTVYGDIGKASFSRSALFAAARRLLAQGEVERLDSLEGGEVVVSKHEGSIFVQVSPTEGKPVQIPFDGLGMLSPDREERLQALDSFLEELGPTAPDFSELRQAAMGHELSDGAVGELLNALWNGVAGRQARLGAQLAAGKATLRDLVPDSFDYFEQFCGPDPGSVAPEEYLGSVLPEYRRGLLRRDLRRGLEICLIGALRDDLCPGTWLEGVNDDELWEVLETCQAPYEPFSLLGALDIALYRQHDDRFRTFAEEAVAKLITDQFLTPDGVDLYEVLPALAQFAVNRINLMEGGALRAPFWKRVCAWMQASQVIHLLDSLGVNWDKLRRHLDSMLVSAGRYASLIDLRREPLYEASEFSPFSLRREVIHRLLHLQVRHSMANRTVPNADRIVEVAKRLSEESGVPLSWAFPGPLEGHRRPEEPGSVLKEEYKEQLMKLSGDLLLSNMVRLSQLFHLDEETRSTLCEAVSKCPIESDGPGPVHYLINAGLVAAAERDQKLAQTIAASLLTLAPDLKEDAVSLGLQALLIAGAAFEEEGSWAEWLKVQLSAFAARLPAGKASAGLYAQLQELKKVTKLELGIYSQAEALASAGAS